jgi:hypothetical protein
LSDILHLGAISHEMPGFLKLLKERNIPTKLIRQTRCEDLANSRVILIEPHIDQRALLSLKEGLDACLNQGGTVVFNGHLVYPVFEGLSFFQVANGGGKEDFIIERVTPHPVFEGVDSFDLSFRRGVAGFYARGANPPPKDALILNRLKKDQSPVDWLWSRPEGGKIFMHSGNPMWMYVNDNSSAARIAPQLLDWVLEN